ncbi:MAG: hypothetical protein QOD78_2136 [Chloroflexota bacterium]|nr:hypothetical protein [Chloroflexota bacterium]
MHRRSRTSRWLTLAASLAILTLSGSTATALAGNTRSVTVGSPTDGQLPSVTVSAGESIIFPIRVSNNGRQTLNNVLLVVGQDGQPLVDEKDPQTAVVPQTPTNLPANVTISDGADLCTDGATLRCQIGTLAARTSITVTVTISSTRAAAAAVIPTKAVVTVAEIGNDNGSNVDTFAAEGSLNLLAFSCDSISAFRTNNQSKVVSTCAVTDPLETSGQSAIITLPAHLSAVGLTDNLAQACPAALATCYGNAAVEAKIDADTSLDTIAWVIDVKLAPGTNVNVYKVVVYHEDDAGNVTLIPLTKKDGCKSATQTNCGVAQIVDVNGTSILRVSFQTAGNGKARV